MWIWRKSCVRWRNMLPTEKLLDTVSTFGSFVKIFRLIESITASVSEYPTTVIIIITCPCSALCFFHRNHVFVFCLFKWQQLQKEVFNYSHFRCDFAAWRQKHCNRVKSFCGASNMISMLTLAHCVVVERKRRKKMNENRLAKQSHWWHNGSTLSEHVGWCNVATEYFRRW